MSGLNGHMSEALSGMTDALSEYGVKMSNVLSEAIISGIENGTIGASEYLSGIKSEEKDYKQKSKEEEKKTKLEEAKAKFKNNQAVTAGELKSQLTQLAKSKAISQTQKDKWNAKHLQKNSVNGINDAIAAGNNALALTRLSGLIAEVDKEMNKKGKTAAQKKQLNTFLKALKKWNKSIQSGVKKGYASGVRKLSQDEIAWTQEYGDEAILSPTRNAVLTPLKAGDSVLTAEQTSNLFKFAQNPFDYLKSIMKVEQVEVAGTGGITLQIDNVLTVQGDVNNSNAKEIASIAQQAITKAFNDFSSKIKK